MKHILFTWCTSINLYPYTRMQSHKGVNLKPNKSGDNRVVQKMLNLFTLAVVSLDDLQDMHNNNKSRALSTFEKWKKEWVI